MENGAYIERYLNELKGAAERIDCNAIDRAIELLFRAWQHGNAVFLCGNGGSAGTATHFAADLFKCTIVQDQPRLHAISLVDNIPLVSALVNDDGWDKIYVAQLVTLFRPGDIVLGISVHGGSGCDKAGLWSQNLLQAMAYAKEHGGFALGFSGFGGGAMMDLADVSVVVPADSTPLVESFHVVLHHLITFCLAEKIRGSIPCKAVAHAASSLS